jgi:hypothetical protein
MAVQLCKLSHTCFVGLGLRESLIAYNLVGYHISVSLR